MSRVLAFRTTFGSSVFGVGFVSVGAWVSSLGVRGRGDLQATEGDLLIVRTFAFRKEAVDADANDSQRGAYEDHSAPIVGKSFGFARTSEIWNTVLNGIKAAGKTTKSMRALFRSLLTGDSEQLRCGGGALGNFGFIIDYRRQIWSGLSSTPLAAIQSFPGIIQRRGSVSSKRRMTQSCYATVVSLTILSALS